MSDQDHDKLDDLDLEALYAEGAEEVPPAELDALIRETAVKKRERGRQRRTFKAAPGLASAAVVLLALGIVLNQDRYAPEMPQGAFEDRAVPTVSAVQPALEEVAEAEVIAPAPQADSAYLENQVSQTAGEPAAQEVSPASLSAPRRERTSGAAKRQSSPLRSDLAKPTAAFDLAAKVLAPAYRLVERECETARCPVALEHDACRSAFQTPDGAIVTRLDNSGLRYEHHERHYRVTCANDSWLVTPLDTEEAPAS